MSEIRMNSGTSRPCKWHGIPCVAALRNANTQSPVDVYMVSQTAAMMDVEEGQCREMLQRKQYRDLNNCRNYFGGSLLLL